MTAFSATIEAQLSGATVACAPLVMLDFRSGAMRLWGGAGDLLAGGEVWKGIARYGSISAISAGPGQAIEELTFTLFATPEALASFEADTAETTGRDALVYFQFFDLRQRDEAGNWVEWATLDDPFQLFAGTMGPPVADRPSVGIGEQATRTLTVRATNPFLNRRRPSFSFFSQRDQQARHPGDNIFINASRMASAKAIWPTF